MFRILIYPSSGACDCAVELPHQSFCSRFVSSVRAAGWSFSLQHGHYSNPAAPNLQHTSNREQTTNVVIQQLSRKLLMMDILMSETCWVHKKWNRIESGMKLVFYSSVIFVVLLKLGRPRRRWADNIRMDLQEVGCVYRDWIGLAQDRQVADACECGNEPSGSVKCGEFLDKLPTS